MTNTSNQPIYGPPKSGIREFFEQGLITVIMALFLMTFIAQAVAVPTGSMQNTINIGDHLFVNKFVFGKPTPVLGKLLPTREIRRGDIIVFKWPSDPKTNYVKRVIGLPGDTVHVKGHKVFVNGKELPEERAYVAGYNPREPELKVTRVDAKPAGATYRVYLDESKAGRGDRDDEFDADRGLPYAVKEPVTVPPDRYFVMGDSRDNSQDGRYWGFVPRENVFARALYVHLAFDPAEENMLKKLLSIRWRRIGSAVK